MDMRYAQAFFEAAKTLHFGKAAEKLSIAPSALTRQIQLFEESIGESLFVRSNRKVILSPKGKELLEVLSPVLNWKEQQAIKLRVGGLAGVMDNHFWPKIDDFVAGKTIKVTVTEMTSGPALQGLLKGDLDISFVNEKTDNDLIDYFSLGREELVLISKKKISLKDAGQCTWIYGGRGSKLKALSPGIESTRQICVSSIEKAYDLVEAGVGIAVVPLSESLTGRGFTRFPVAVKNRNTYLAVLKYNSAPAHLRELIKLVLGK